MSKNFEQILNIEDLKRLYSNDKVEIGKIDLSDNDYIMFYNDNSDMVEFFKVNNRITYYLYNLLLNKDK
jgi:hypothetical protein